jgi:hypothetical protein
MTDRNTAFNRSSRADSNTIPWANVSGETIPAFGVIQLRDNFSVVSQGKKPNSKTGLFFTNGPVSVATGGRGESRLWNKPQSVSVEATVTVGEEIGPTSGSWKMSSAGAGFRVIRQDTDTIAVVERVGGSGGQSGIHGIVREDRGKGYYWVELSDWAGMTADCGSGSGSGCDACPPAESGSGLGDCSDVTVPTYEPQTVVKDDPEFILAYDAESTVIPIVIGSDCIMLDMGDTNLSLGSGSGSVSGSDDEEPVYQIIRRVQTMTVQYKETYECCDGVDTLIRRQAIIFNAKVCDEQTCAECESGSAA